MLGLNELAREFAKKEYVPTALDNLYLFYLENGVTLADLEELPIPYIINCYLSAQYHNSKTKKANGNEQH